VTEKRRTGKEARNEREKTKDREERPGEQAKNRTEELSSLLLVDLFPSEVRRFDSKRRRGRGRGLIR
jgi:hypothetical protein